MSLKSCPMCYGPVSVTKGQKSWTRRNEVVRCDKCDLEMLFQPGTSQKRIIKEWNKQPLKKKVLDIVKKKPKLTWYQHTWKVIMSIYKFIYDNTMKEPDEEKEKGQEEKIQTEESEAGKSQDQNVS